MILSKLEVDRNSFLFDAALTHELALDGCGLASEGK
jgi:hypothetical protein